jgi:hypothetical protein
MSKCGLSGCIFLFASVIVLGAAPAVAAEPEFDWQLDSELEPNTDPNFNRGLDAASRVEGGVTPPPARGPIRILPPNVGLEPVNEEIESSSDEDMVLFPSGPGANGQPTMPLQNLGARPGEVNSGIEIGTLGQVDEGSVGLLDSSNGGLGTAMWTGTGRRVVERLLGQVPGPTSSPVMGDLARRLLLTSARPPQGAHGGVSLLALRLHQLNAAGRADDIVQLLARSGGARPSPAAAMEFANGALGAGDTNRACNMLSVLPVGGDTSSDEIAAFALRLSIFCQISGGQLGAANLTVELAREQGFGDLYFLALAAQATDGLKLDAPIPAVFDALTFRMLLLAKRPVPNDVVARVTPNLLVSMAAGGAYDPEIQVAAAERAAALGLLSGDEMAAAYLSVPYSREDVDGVRIGREPASPYRRRALYHQAVLDELVPAGRADLLSTLFFREAAGDAYRATLLAHMSSLSSVPPSSVLTAFAPLAVRAFVERGDRVRAGMWLSVLEGQDVAARQQRELRAIVRLIDPGARIVPLGFKAEDENNFIPAILQDALDDLATGGQARDFAAMEIVLLDALGFQISQSVWDALLAAGDLPSGVVPSPTLMRKLQIVSENAQRGETVMLVLAGLAEAGPSGTHPKSIGDMVAALMRVGLEEDARRLAVEALLARMSGEG